MTEATVTRQTQSATFVRAEDQKVVTVTAVLTPGEFRGLLWRHYSYPAYLRSA